MSVRQGLLVLLAQQPMYGAQLRAEFEQRTGGTWPLNIGQVYTTLARLQRDGMVESAGEADEEGRIEYSLTAEGRAEVQRWWDEPSDLGRDPRDELTIKLALAVTVAGVDVTTLVQRQRAAGLEHLRALTAQKRDGLPDLPSELVLERRIFDAESLIRWLDHVESRLTQAAPHVTITEESR